VKDTKSHVGTRTDFLLSYRLQIQTARRVETCEPSGGPFGIDQEVVTLRGLFGYSGFTSLTTLTDLRQAVQSLLTDSMRAVAPGAFLRIPRPKPRLERPALSLSHLTWSLGSSTTAF
jgi:hypothetical protein